MPDIETATRVVQVKANVLGLGGFVQVSQKSGRVVVAVHPRFWITGATEDSAEPLGPERVDHLLRFTTRVNSALEKARETLLGSVDDTLAMSAEEFAAHMRSKRGA